MPRIEVLALHQPKETGSPPEGKWSAGSESLDAAFKMAREDSGPGRLAIIIASSPIDGTDVGGLGGPAGAIVHEGTGLSGFGHEIGRAAGYEGHSDKPGNLMLPFLHDGPNQIDEKYYNLMRNWSQRKQP